MIRLLTLRVFPASPPHILGYANGIAQSIVSFARFVGPVLGGYVSIEARLIVVPSITLTVLLVFISCGRQVSMETHLDTHLASLCVRA